MSITRSIITYCVERNQVPAGPTVAFFGDSFTFGQGLPDSETLPQIYADITGRKVHVLNFGFPGYGPQQFLRAMETGMFDPLLNNTKLFIYETGNWLIERSACRPGFMSRAPRYTLRDGTPLYQGACLEGWRRALSDIASGSSLFSRFSGALTKPVSKADVELYIAEFARSAQLVKQKYGGRLIILYIPYAGPYLEKSGFTDAQIEKTATRRGPKRLGCTSTPKTFSPGTPLMIAGDGHPTGTATVPGPCSSGIISLRAEPRIKAHRSIKTPLSSLKHKCPSYKTINHPICSLR